MLAFPALAPALLAALLPFTLAAATTTSPSYPAPTSGTITGAGYISVLANTTSHGAITYVTGSPASQTVGCLNAVGKVVLDGCALFTAQGYHVATDAGVCTFKNASAPVNSDAVYGGSVHAFTCVAHEAVSSDAQFYTVSGLPYNFIGQGDTDLYYDLPALPVLSSDEIDFWYFVWGSAQTNVPDGHYKALLLWEPTS